MESLVKSQFVAYLHQISNMKAKVWTLALACIVIGFVYRLIPGTPHNFTPIAAIALVGGLYLSSSKWAFTIPIAALFLSDLVLNNTINRVFFTEQTGMIIWADYMIWTYGAMLLTVLVGILSRNKSTLVKIGLGTLLSSIAFFAISNFGSWLTLPMYTKDLGGLLACYVAALPFFKATLLSNFVFISLFVGGIEWMAQSKRKPALA